MSNMVPNIAQQATRPCASKLNLESNFMNLEQLEKSANSYHKATVAIVQKIINNPNYTPSYYPIVVNRDGEVSCIVDASNDIQPNTDYIEPYIFIGSFSLELKMKLLILHETGNLVKGHNLKELFESMTEETKQDVHISVANLTKNSKFHELGSQVIKNYCKVQFAWDPLMLISNSSDAFVRWRYFYEGNPDVPWFAGYSELQHAFDNRISRLKEGS